MIPPPYPPATTNIYFAGSSAQYDISYDGDVVTVTDTQPNRNGVKTLTLSGGTTTPCIQRRFPGLVQHVCR